MASETSRSNGSAADSYVGSLISLTSKYEIRYEGVLYNINTDESSIGLTNVRSFGTEGRKKDGPQVQPSEKVYEYILFRGSDIKDLQVKSTQPPVQPPAPVHSDPAIIQSHYSHPPAVSTSLPPSLSGSAADPSSHQTHMGIPRSTQQGGVPLYQPGGSLGSWGSTPPPNSSGLSMPMYWQGFYGPASGLPPSQQPLLQPPTGLSLPPSMQQPMQYPGLNAALPTAVSNLPSSSTPPSNASEFLSPAHPPFSSGALNLNSSLLRPNFPSNLAPTLSAASASQTIPNLVPTRIPTADIPNAIQSGSSLFLTTSGEEKNTIVPPVSDKPQNVAGESMSVSSTFGTSRSSSTETPLPSLITPGQLLQQPLQKPGSAVISSSESSQTTHKDGKVVQAPLSSEQLPSSSKETQAPLLPLPTPSGQKPNGAALQTRNSHSYNYSYGQSYRGRGRGRGRGNGFSRPITKFTEDFDFMAMNEKFKKEEVWGDLGKGNKAGDGEEENDGDYSNDEDDAGSSKTEVKTGYIKDDFFDSLSSNALDRGSHNGRTKFSEQRKIDTETFGDFPRHHGGRGGRGPGRGGRSRGPYRGEVYGYGWRGRGRGQSHSMSGRGN